MLEIIVHEGPNPHTLYKQQGIEAQAIIVEYTAIMYSIRVNIPCSDVKADANCLVLKKPV